MHLETFPPQCVSSERSGCSRTFKIFLNSSFFRLFFNNLLLIHCQRGTSSPNSPPQIDVKFTTPRTYSWTFNNRLRSKALVQHRSSFSPSSSNQFLHFQISRSLTSFKYDTWDAAIRAEHAPHAPPPLLQPMPSPVTPSCATTTYSLTRFFIFIERLNSIILSSWVVSNPIIFELSFTISPINQSHIARCISTSM